MAEEKTSSFMKQPAKVRDTKYNNLVSSLTSQTVGGRSFSDISKAIQDAEVGGDKNTPGWPYIFTKSGRKSSAFGPAQILYSTALDYFYDGANETERRDNMKAGNFKEGYTQLPPDVKSYIKRFIQQGIKKRNNKKPQDGGAYGNLGIGDISREDHEKYYPFLFGVHVKEKKKIAKDDTVASFVNAHYGDTEVRTSTGEVDEDATTARKFQLSSLQTKVNASLGDAGFAEAPDTTTTADFKSVISDKNVQDLTTDELQSMLKAPGTLAKKVAEREIARRAKVEMPDDVVEPGTTDTLEEVEQEQFQADVDAADRDEQLQQAESLKAQTAKAIPTKPEPEPEQPSFLDRLFGRDEPTQEALDAKKSVLERLGRFKNKPVVSGVPTMNKGGVSIKEQMSMFDDGGLLDEGGTVDPVSGNKVPPGSMQEEVRDDIPAQLSEGEFVFPADVVRYIGLEKLMRLRQEAKMGLKRMEAMGQMGNSDEAIIPDDLPFTLDDLELEDEPVEMQIGGFVDPNITMQQSQFGQMAPVQPPVYIPPPPPPPFVPTQQAATPVMAVPEVLPTFEQLMPAPEGRYDELVEFENKNTGQKMTIPFVNGQPIYPIPQGFTRVETDIVEPTPEPEVVPTARVESAREDDPSDDKDPGFSTTDVTGIGYDRSKLDDSLRSAISEYGFGFGALGETFNVTGDVLGAFGKDPKAKTANLTSSAFGGILDAYRGGNVSFSTPGRVGRKTGNYADNTPLHEMSAEKQMAISVTAASVMTELEPVFRNKDGSSKTRSEVDAGLKTLADELGIDITVRGTNLTKPRNTIIREIAKQKAEIKRQEEERERQRQEEMRQAAEAAREAKLAKEAEQRRRIEEASRLAVGSEERNRAFGERDDSSSTGFTEGSIIDTAVREAIQDVATTAENYQDTGGYFDDYE